ncbi:TetR/AcrR family transcriptional regulator [Actinoplanes sp. NPDC051470]|uniref:TetR/AcrR family transcriptional regulator n=1 Tax=unclassified Actinoplanes TaxID=2626549 RepID=UPI003433A544
MPNRGDRGGSQTRNRISEVATELFLRRGFEDVTIAEVAEVAGVSKVTVFAHFQRKEDLLLDRLPDAIGLVRRVVRERADDVGVVAAFRAVALDLVDQRHPLSGLSAEAEPFVRTVLASPALIARLRGFASEIEARLAAELRDDARFTGDSDLVAGLLVTAYRVVAVETTRRLLAHDDPGDLAGDHRRRLVESFDLLESGLP